VFALALVAPALLTVRASEPLLVFPLRYFHLPLAGFAIALLPTVSRFWTRIARFALPAIVCLLLMLSWVRIDQWKSDISLFYAEARYNQESAQTLVNLGAALCGRGAYDEAERVSVLLDEVISRAGNKLSSAGAANIKAMIAAYRDGDFEAASAILEGALKEDPTVMTNVFSLAEIRADAGHPEQAVIILERALEAPWFEDARREKLELRLEGYRRRAAAKTAASME
jgi:tetratricopeptide (TPR) repeat protein